MRFCRLELALSPADSFEDLEADSDDDPAAALLANSCDDLCRFTGPDGGLLMLKDCGMV